MGSSMATAAAATAMGRRLGLRNQEHTDDRCAAHNPFSRLPITGNTHGQMAVTRASGVLASRASGLSRVEALRTHSCGTCAGASAKYRCTGAGRTIASYSASARLATTDCPAPSQRESSAPSAVEPAR